LLLEIAMRALLLLPLIAAFAACSPATPPSGEASPGAKPPAPAAAPASGTKADEPKSAETKPAEKLPEIGTCGDQSAVPAEQRIANTPRWTLASQQDTFGFDVYRGDAEEGPFARITPKPILGAGTTDETHKYEYRDDSIDPCKAYWYYVEEISTNGGRSKFTPVFRAAPKRRAADAGH
jgi:hypothetical protein